MRPSSYLGFCTRYTPHTHFAATVRPAPPVVDAPPPGRLPCHQADQSQRTLTATAACSDAIAYHAAHSRRTGTAYGLLPCRGQKTGHHRPAAAVSRSSFRAEQPIGPKLRPPPRQRTFRTLLPSPQTPRLWQENPRITKRGFHWQTTETPCVVTLPYGRVTLLWH